jgi:hypothetical protein
MKMKSSTKMLATCRAAPSRHMKISTERSREIKGDVGHLTRRAEQAHEDP